MTHQEAYHRVQSKLPTGDYGVSKRLERAWSLVIGWGYEFTCHNPEFHTRYWTVEKLSTSLMQARSVVYQVTDESCTCPDFSNARGGLCKHRLAVMILTEMREDDSLTA